MDYRPRGYRVLLRVSFLVTPATFAFTLRLHRYWIVTIAPAVCTNAGGVRVLRAIGAKSGKQCRAVKLSRGEELGHAPVSDRIGMESQWPPLLLWTSWSHDKSTVGPPSALRSSAVQSGSCRGTHPRLFTLTRYCNKTVF